MDGQTHRWMIAIAHPELISEKTKTKKKTVHKTLTHFHIKLEKWKLDLFVLITEYMSLFNFEVHVKAPYS